MGQCCEHRPMDKCQLRIDHFPSNNLKLKPKISNANI